jgi:hypothetical protein
MDAAWEEAIKRGNVELVLDLANRRERWRRSGPSRDCRVARRAGGATGKVRAHRLDPAARLITYKVAHDEGSAPNPYFKLCTLAMCKAENSKVHEKR